MMATALPEQKKPDLANSALWFIFLITIVVACGTVFYAFERRVNSRIDEIISGPPIAYTMTSEGEQDIPLTATHILRCARGGVAYRSDNIADRYADLEAVCAKVWSQHMASIR